MPHDQIDNHIDIILAIVFQPFPDDCHSITGESDSERQKRANVSMN